MLCATTEGDVFDNLANTHYDREILLKQRRRGSPWPRTATGWHAPEDVPRLTDCLPEYLRAPIVGLVQCWIDERTSAAEALQLLDNATLELDAQVRAHGLCTAQALHSLMYCAIRIYCKIHSHCMRWLMELQRAEAERREQDAETRAREAQGQIALLESKDLHNLICCHASVLYIRMAGVRPHLETQG